MTKLVLITLVLCQLIYGTLARPDNYRLSEEQKTRLKNIATKWKGALNLDKNPCDEFYDFICSNTEDLTPETKDAEDRLKGILNENPDIVTEAEEKYLLYSTTCKQYKAEEEEEFIKSFKFDNSIGNWPAFEEKWDESKFNLPLAIIEMNSFDYPVVFAQTLLFDPADISKTYLKINKQELVDIEKNKKLFKTQFEKLGVKNPEDILADAALFEKTFNEAAKSKKSSHDLKTTFTELKILIPEVDLDEQMEKIYGGKLVGNYPVLIKSHDELNEIYKAISKLSPKTIANYFFCAFVQNVKETEYIQSPVFVPVIKQAFMKHIYDQDTKDILKGMYITMLEILQDENILVNFKTYYSSDQIAKFISDIFALANDEDLATELKEVSTNKNECVKNYHRLQQLYKKSLAKPFFNSNNAIVDLVRVLINKDLVYYIPRFIEMPSPFLLESILFSIMPKLVDNPPNATIYSSARECFAKQLSEKITNGDMKTIWSVQLLLKAFAEWTKNYPDFAQEEDKILQKYNLSAEKFQIIANAKYDCGRPEAFNVVMTAFATSMESPQIYDCPAGSKLNSATKCSFWSN